MTIIISDNNSNILAYIGLILHVLEYPVGQVPIAICILFWGALFKRHHEFRIRNVPSSDDQIPQDIHSFDNEFFNVPEGPEVSEVSEVKDGKMKPSMVRCDQGGHRDMWENWANNSSVLTENH